MGDSLNKPIESFMEIKDSNPLIFLDYDGTLVGIQMNPEDATADDALIDELHELSRIYETYIVTGRSMEGIEGFLGTGFNIIALHGAISKINGNYVETVDNFSSYRNECDTLFERRLEFIDRYPGLRVYNKHGNVLFHMGLMENGLRAPLIEEVRNMASSVNMEMYLGKMIVEIRVPGINKGIAIHRTRKGRPSLIAGDDATDEEAFMANPDALRIKIGADAETCADYTLDNPEEMKKLLRRIIDISR